MHLYTGSAFSFTKELLFPTSLREKKQMGWCLNCKLPLAEIHKAHLAIPKVHVGGLFAKLLIDPDEEQTAMGAQKPTFLTHLPSLAQVAVAAGAAPVVVVDAEAVRRAHGLVARQVKEAGGRRHAAPPRCPRCGHPYCGWRPCDGSSGRSGFRSGCKDPWQKPGTRPWSDLCFNQKFSVASFNSRKWSELKGGNTNSVKSKFCGETKLISFKMQIRGNKLIVNEKKRSDHITISKHLISHIKLPDKTL